MYPHQIRLAAPWERHELPSGRMRYRRRFGRPRQLDDWERVWIIAPEGVRNETWTVNNTELRWLTRGDSTIRAAVTSLLRNRNELIVECDADMEFAGAILEIGCRAWIQDVRIERQSSEWLVAVELRSESSDDPLELYVSVDGENRGYRGPVAIGRAWSEEFRIPQRGTEIAGRVTLGVDLICRSTIWDRREIEIEF